MKPPPPTPLRWRLLALATVAVFLTLVARFWHPVYGFSAFFQIDAPNDDLKIAAFRELPVYVHRDTGGYDGLYYAQIAHDPSLRDPQLPRAMDNFAYRARRILPPAIAWLAGGGQPAGIVFAYSVVNLAAWLALAWLLWRLLEVRDVRGWLAWAGVLFSAGAVSSVRLALTDLPALALIAGAIWAAERWRGRTAVAVLAAAGLARETSLLAVSGLCKAPWLSGKNVARVVLVAAPLTAWLAYIRWRVGSADQGWSNLTWPVVGLLEKIRDASVATVTIADKPLAWTTVLATIGLVVQAAFFVVRRQLADRWWRVGANYTVLLLWLGTAVWEGFPGAATRVLLPLNLAFNVLAHRTRAHVAWLIAGNLTVCAGLLAVRDVPHDPREIAALRVTGTAAIARAGDGWHGREAHGRNTWFWTARGGTIEVETWPKAERVFVLQFQLRAIRPCTVVVRQAGRELGRFEAGPARTDHAIYPLPIVAGRGVIEFATDATPTRENDAADARELTFALYNPRLGVKKL